MSPVESLPEPWAGVRDRFRHRGLRWTPQRRTVVEVLAATDGHVTGAELLSRCRDRDPQTIPSTVYRTLDTLKRLGPNYIGRVVGSGGFSRGEDKLLGPPDWKANPAASRGSRAGAISAVRVSACAEPWPANKSSI